jgi:hypothetical protein
MAKRCLLVLTLLCLCTLSAFSLSSGSAGNAGNVGNAGNKKNAGDEENFLSLDVYIAGIGARYERFLSPKFSLGVDVNVLTSFFIHTEFEAGVFARYYLWKGLYGELGLGFHIHGESEDKYLDSSYPIAVSVTTTGVAITPGLGWKFDPGKAGGFFIEPGISVPITIGKKSWAQAITTNGVKTTSYGGSESGVKVGFMIYCGLGWAF